MAGLGVDVSLHIALNTIKHCNWIAPLTDLDINEWIVCAAKINRDEMTSSLLYGMVAFRCLKKSSERKETKVERERESKSQLDFYLISKHFTWFIIWKKMEFHSTWENWYIMAKSRGESRQITIVNTISSSEIDIISGSGWLHFCSHRSIIVAKLNLWFWWRLNVVLLLNERKNGKDHSILWIHKWKGLSDCQIIWWRRQWSHMHEPSHEHEIPASI